MTKRTIFSQLIAIVHRLNYRIFSERGAERRVQKISVAYPGAKRYKPWLKRFLLSAPSPNPHQRRQRSSHGFTLIELLVTTVIAAIIMIGLTYIVVELMGTDQRESARAESQREMQMALDYMSTELREAVYVYPGEFLQCAGQSAGDCSKGYDSLLNYLPQSLSTDNSVPVLAFWKQQPFPDAAKTKCASTTPPDGVSCLAGSSYALIVYSVVPNPTGGVWSKGNARVTRYALTEFKSDGSFTKGYVNPGAGSSFTAWPYGADPNGAIVNLQSIVPISGRPAGRPDDASAVTLVDFVDPTAGAEDWSSTNTPCPGAYSLAPIAANQSGTVASLVKAHSFFACVSSPSSSLNQDVVLFVRGTAKARPGIAGSNFFLPTLQTRVLSRGFLSGTPNN